MRLGLLALLLIAPAARAEEGTPALLADLARTYGVTVHVRYDRDRFFPARWRKAPNDVQGGQVAAADVDRLVAQVAAFVKRYPRRVVRAHLANVYLLKSFSARGKRYGASYFGTNLYIVGAGDDFVRSRLHSEFSSVLMRRYRFPYRDWFSANVDGWRYGGRGFDMLGKGGLYDQDDGLLERGFLVRYAQSSLENDFNMFSDWMFTKPEELRRIAIKHPRIKRKMKIAHEFYLKVWGRK